MSKRIDYIIFTDASMRNSYRGRGYCAYSAVLLNVRTRKYTQIGDHLGGHTISFGEGYAVYAGIKALRDVLSQQKKRKRVEVLVVSDSKLTIQVFTEFIPKTWNTKKRNRWVKSDGSKVKNQMLYQHIVDLMNNTPNIHVRFTHINSHLTEDDWEYVQEKLTNYHISATPETVQLFIQMNALADNIATQITYDERYLEDRIGEFYRLKRVGSDTPVKPGGSYLDQA